MTELQMIDVTVMEILESLLTNGQMNSTDLVNSIKHGHKTIWDRLKYMRKYGLISRRVDRDRSVYYMIEDRGRFVLESMKAIQVVLK